MRGGDGGVNRDAGGAVDADVHHHIADWAEVAPYAPPGLRHRLAQRAGPKLARHGFKKIGVGFGRGVELPETGTAHPAADPEWVRDHYVLPRGIHRAVLTTPLLSLGSQPDGDLAAAIAQAVNDWTLEKWVRPHDCFKASLLVAQQMPELAVAEIDRLGDDPGVVQVLMTSGGPMPLGKRCYHGIYEACARHDLPIALHIGGEGAGMAGSGTAVGHPSTYFEWYAALPQTYLAHVTSMVTEGVFDRFPSLKVVLYEGGLLWLPQLMWRFDKNWKSHRAETPWVKDFPSRYIAEHFYLTMYPLEAVPDPEYLAQVLEMMDGSRILFSSNYPNWEYGDPLSMLDEFPEEMRTRISANNAQSLYGDRIVAANR